MCIDNKKWFTGRWSKFEVQNIDKSSDEFRILRLISKYVYRFNHVSERRGKFYSRFFQIYDDAD